MSLNSNMSIFEQLRTTPPEARKEIKGGRLKGFTDINPMWRFKRLTEVFGPCGIGWKYEIVNQRLQPGHGNEVAAFVDILLYYKKDGAWSEGIPGVGGSMFVTTEKGGVHTNDECFKMALTDAISTAAKALGMSADIHFEKDRTKYGAQNDGSDNQKQNPVDKAAAPIICHRCGKEITGVKFRNGGQRTVEEILEISRKNTNSDLCWSCLRNYGGGGGAN